MSGRGRVRGAGPRPVPTVLVLSLLLAPGPAGAQEEGSAGDVAAARTEVGRYTVPGPAARSGAAQDTASADTASYVRETFVYPVAGRRDPFEPVAGGPSAGPAFGDLRLAGILYSPQVGSIAVLVDVTTGRRYRLREGDRIGEARLVDVGPNEAAFEVMAFGVTRREVLQVKKEEEGPR